MVSGVKVSNKVDTIIPIKQTITSSTESLNEMTESKGIQAIANQAATAMIMTLGEANVGPRSGAIVASLRETHKDMVDQL